jgi:hypothetical protein
MVSIIKCTIQGPGLRATSDEQLRLRALRYQRAQYYGTSQ